MLLSFAVLYQLKCSQEIRLRCFYLFPPRHQAGAHERRRPDLTGTKGDF